MDSRIITRLELIVDRLEDATRVCLKYELDLDDGYASSAGYSRSAMMGSAQQLRDIISEINELHSQATATTCQSTD